MTALKLVVNNPQTDPLQDACVVYYKAQKQIKDLNEARDELRLSMGFAATVLRDAVIAVGQHQKKFGDYTVHVDQGYDVFCKGCGTFATSCGCQGGPLEVHAIPKPRIWISRADKSAEENS